MSPGWLGYTDEKLVRLAKQAVIGPNIKLAVDANQRWDVPDAIAWMRSRMEFDLALRNRPVRMTSSGMPLSARRGCWPTIPAARSARRRR